MYCIVLYLYLYMAPRAVCRRTIYKFCMSGSCTYAWGLMHAIPRKHDLLHSLTGNRLSQAKATLAGLRGCGAGACMEYTCAAPCDRKGSLQAKAVLLWRGLHWIHIALCDRKGSLQAEAVLLWRGLASNTYVQRPVTGRVHFRLRRCFSEGGLHGIHMCSALWQEGFTSGWGGASLEHKKGSLRAEVVLLWRGLHWIHTCSALWQKGFTSDWGVHCRVEVSSDWVGKCANRQSIVNTWTPEEST